MRFRRKTRGWGWGALLAVVLAPSAAQAQLFPNLPTQKRARIDCAEELPVYGMYRHKYYGYYPTCWRQFPPGWGCPSTESPDWQAELARQPLDIPEDEFAGLDGLGADPFGDPADDDLLPELPRQRSPFELDQPGAGESPPDAPRRAPSPFGADPFETPDRGGPAPSSPAPSPFDLPGASSTGPDAAPLLNPPITSGLSESEGTDPIASLPRLPHASELAVLPDSRPRPIRLPSESGAAPFVNASTMSEVPQEVIGADVTMPNALTSRPVGPLATDPLAPPHDVSAGVITDPRGVQYAPALGGAEVPVEIEYPEARPRRRLFSGLFGRGR